MKVGYCRVSTADQNLNLQLDALAKEGCSHIFKDIISGSVDQREGLKKALNFLKEGDQLVVFKFDRASRNLRSLIDLVAQLNQRGIGFKSISEQVDTTTPAGKFSLHLFGALAEFERELIRERTISGLEAARARGRIGGRPSKLSMSQVQIAEQLFSERNHSVDEIARSLGVSRATLYRSIKFKRE